VVGAPGFEPGASCSQSRRATRLRHAPTLSKVPGEGGRFPRPLDYPTVGILPPAHGRVRLRGREQVATMGTDHTPTDSVFDARLRDLQAREDRATSEQRRAERDLRERDVRLAVNSDIARAFRDGEPSSRVVQRVVDSLHTHFSHFQSSYATVSADGLVTVAYSAGTEEPSSDATPPVLSPETLAEVDLVATGATGDDTTSAALPAALAAGDAPAVLQAPVRHAARLAGILALGSMTPHAWSPQERIMLREVADLLGFALRNAEATIRLEDSEERFR
jgi:transcriptional regulator with GAF, ATPase, and Fis domain